MTKSTNDKLVIKLPKPHKGGQRAIYLHPARFQVLACGRRYGKTELGKVLSYREMVKNGGEVWWVAPQYKMSTKTWHELLSAFRPIATWVSAQERTIVLSNGGKLVVWSGDAGETMRGGSPSLVIMDEAAMITDNSLWFGVIQPALMDNKGRAYFLSTPRGRNWFYDVYVMGMDFSGNMKRDEQYKSWNFSSYNNPHIDPKVIDSTKLSTPDRFFRQEYMAEFLTDSGSVFRGVLDISTMPYMKPYPGRFSVGVDWGRKEDYTAVSIFDIDAKTQVHLERMSKVDFPTQIAFLKGLFEEWRPLHIGIEENSFGLPAADYLRKEGIKFKSIYMTNKRKREVIELLSLNIEQRKIKLLNERIQINELQAYQMNTTAHNNITYNAASGYHDDTVIATGLANYMMEMSINTFGGGVPIISGWT
jgi:hypothetical protein